MKTQTNIAESETNDIWITTGPTPIVEPPEVDTQRLISEIKYLAPDELKAHPRNAEIYGNTPDEELQANIKANGVITPILASWEKIIVSGNRRHRCALLAGLTQIPVVFTDSTDEHDMLELLLAGNVQRKKSEDTLFQEVEILKEIETVKAKKRQATARRGKMGGQPLPAESPEGVGEVRTIVARKLEIGEKKVDEIGKVAAKINLLKEGGLGEEAQALRETVTTQGIRAAAKQVKLAAAESSIPAKPSKSKGQTPKAVKSEIIEEIRNVLTRDLLSWAVPRLTAFQADLAEYRRKWEADHPVSPERELKTEVETN